MALPSQAMYLESSKDRFLKHIKESKEINNEGEEKGTVGSEEFSTKIRRDL
jgi:hypothetical protein